MLREVSTLSWISISQSTPSNSVFLRYILIYPSIYIFAKTFNSLEVLNTIFLRIFISSLSANSDLDLEANTVNVMKYETCL